MVCGRFVVSLSGEGMVEYCRWFLVAVVAVVIVVSVAVVALP